jgi:membrane protein YdbS with pleckstrin-like domain
METVQTSPPQTKPCPFCAETIQAQAIKCRFCGEFLNSTRSQALKGGPAAPAQSEGDGKAEHILFRGRPSLWGMVGAGIKGLIFFAIAVFLMVYPIENASVFRAERAAEPAVYDGSAEEPPESEFGETITEEKAGFGLNGEQASVFGRYRVITGIGLAVVVVLALLLKMAQLKMTYYEVTPDRIEWSRGILDRKVDNLDMFRVVDLKLRRSLLDCILGIGTVGLITTDKTDPKFTFEKMRDSRRLYDVIKKASLNADQKQRVVHLE